MVVPPNLPTAIVTTLPGGACVPPAGSWVWTIPSWLGSETGCGTIRTLKPEAFSWACASFCEMLVTSGTIDVVGPFETVSLIFVFGGCSVPGPGSIPMTVFFG